MSEDLQVMNPMQTQLNSFSSFKVETLEDKKFLYNATTKPDSALADHVNEVISVKDVYVEMVEITNDQTGERSTQPRTILFDTAGKSYACVSSGIFNSLTRAFAIFGPPTWEDGLAFKVIQIRKGKNNIMSLQLA